MADYFNEIEQAEALKSWCKKYGKWLLALIVLVCVGIISWNFWQHRLETQQNRASLVYENMMDSIGNNNDDAAKSQAKYLVSNFGKTGYGQIGRLYLAKLASSQQHYQEALSHLQQVAAHSKNNNIATIARLRIARINVAQGKSQQAVTLLTPYLSSDQFALPTRLVLAYAYQQQHQYHKAKSMYDQALTKTEQNTPAYNFIKTMISGLPVNTNS